MSLAAASFGFAPAPLVTPAIMPSNLGSAGSQNSPWGYNNFVTTGSQQTYQSPYSTQNYLPSSLYNPAVYSNALQFGNSFNNRANGQFNGNKNNNNNNGSGKKDNKNNKNGSQGNGFSGLFFNKEKKEAEDPYEKWKEEQEEEIKEAKETFVEDLERIVILAVAFLYLEPASAQYFAATEMFSVFLDKMGVSDFWNMIILLAVQCVDVVALFRGRIKLVEGYRFNWYQELYDTVLTRLEIPDMVRLGSQFFMPQSPAPEYEDKR